MSLLDDNDVNIGLDKALHDYKNEKISKYLFRKNVLNNECLFPIHVQVNNVSDFNDWLQDNTGKCYSLNILKFHNLSDVALFVQQLTQPGTVHFANVSDIAELENKDAILNILTGICCKGIIDIEELLRENNAEQYIFPNGVKFLKSSDFKFIFSDTLDTEQASVIYNKYPDLTKEWMVYGDFLNSKEYQGLSETQREEIYNRIRLH